MSSPNTADGWLVVETLADQEMSLVFSDGRTKEFSALRRRKTFLRQAVTDAIEASVTELRNGAENTDHTVRVDTRTVRVLGVPVLGPTCDKYDGRVYGAQIWVGSIDATPPPPRTVVGWSFDPVAGTTFHGPGVDEKILGIPECHGPRTSPEIFQFYDEFPRRVELGPFVASVGACEAPEDDYFDGYIELTNARKESKVVHVSMRGVGIEAKRPLVRGLINEITDVQPHSGGTYERQMARDLARMMATTHGVGQLDFATNIVTEWLTKPLHPLTSWVTEIPTFHPEDCPRVTESRQRIVDGTSEYVETTARVRFLDGQWIETVIGLRAAVVGASGQGLITIRATAAEQPTLLTTNRGDHDDR